MRTEFKSATQIIVNPIHFEIQLILKKALFCICGPEDEDRWNRKNCPKFFHRVIFAFWIQICNRNLCKSHTFWNIANTVKWPCFTYADLTAEINKIEKIVQISFIGVIFVFWILICNPNLCTSDTFWNTTVTSLPWPYRQMYSCIRQKGGRTSSKSPRRWVANPWMPKWTITTKIQSTMWGQ